MNYDHLSFLWRAPDDALIVYQQGRGLDTRIERTAVLVLGRKGDESARLFRFNPVTKGKVEERLAPESFGYQGMGRISFLTTDPVASLVASRRGLNMFSSFWRDSQSWSLSTEKTEHGLQRFDRVLFGGSCQSVLVDSARNRVVRILETKHRSWSSGPGQAWVAEVMETVYQYVPAEKIADAELDPFRGMNGAITQDLSASEFASLADLTEWTREMASAESPGRRPRPVAETSATEPAPSPVAEVQSLSAEQMAAIVLIESEDGAGTGFVTEIRGMPFVVTNLHVIGGVEKLRITTLNGVKIEVGSIHGAVGRDLAIMRIEGAVPAARLKLSEDPLRTAKIGDKVVVVGNRRGGGVATQVSGLVQGIGPEKIEVDAAFQPGNSGSPIIHVESGEVIGLAAYSQTRELDLLDGPSATGGVGRKPEESKTEQRWFGFRTDGVSSWEVIEYARWRDQAARVEAFRAESEAIYNAMRARFTEARVDPAVRRVIERFEERVGRSGPGEVQTAQDVGEFFRSLRSLAENGKKDLSDGQFYDYFRSSLYWESSIPEQLRTREQLARYLDRASENSAAFLSRLRNK